MSEMRCRSLGKLGRGALVEECAFELRSGRLEISFSLKIRG